MGESIREVSPRLEQRRLVDCTEARHSLYKGWAAVSLALGFEGSDVWTPVSCWPAVCLGAKPSPTVREVEVMPSPGR